MNTLTDLRHTLDAHAAEVVDDPASARVVAVRGRARAVRRRRAGSVVAAAAAVVAGVVSLSVLPAGQPPVPAERELIGRVAPATLTSLGYTYAFAEGSESGAGGDRAASLELAPSDDPRLVTWASEAEDVRLRANVEGYSTSSGSTAFDDFVVVPGVEAVRFTLQAGGAEGALAVYELTDDRPAGVTTDGITFREQVADAELIAARIGEPGAVDVTLDVTMPEGRVRLVELCEGTIPERHWVNVEVADEGAMSSSGCGGTGFDPAGNGNGASYVVPADQVGDTVPVRIWVSRELEGPAVAVDGVRLGVGAYEVAPPATTLAGSPVPELIEHEGRTWRFRTSQSVGFATSGGTDYVNRFDQPVLAAGYFQGVGRSFVRFRGGGEGTDLRVGSSGGPLPTVLAPGKRARMSVAGATDRVRMGFAVYLLVD